jgi:selenocysteine lyase/cysteine desulfurase
MSAYADRFEVPDGGPYLLSHSVGCLPRAARTELEAGLFAPWATLGSDGWGDWLGAVDRFRAAAATLIGGKADEVCPQPSISAGLFALLSGLPREPGRDVLLASAHAFPSIGFAMGQFERLGYRLKLLPESADPGDTQVWADAIDQTVAAVVTMHVHSNSGIVSPVAEIAAIARAHGAFSIVDVAQSVGILPIDVRGWGVDALLGTSVKWLCGGSGGVFLWVRAERIADIAPLTVGWFSHEQPFAFDIRDFRYAPDARRFWGGTPSVAPYVLATAGMKTLSEIGIETALAWNRALIATLSQAAGQAFDVTRRGGTLCLVADGDIDRLADALGAAPARFDRRADTVRLSFHLWNTHEEAERIGAVLRDFHVRLV